MHEHDKEQAAETEADIEEVSCEICLQNVPLSESQSEEASDYVAYFCGLNCYDKWKHQET